MKAAYKIGWTLLLALFFAVPAMAGDWGEIREATVNLNVRAERDKNAEHAMTLAKGERVKCDFLKDGWVAIFDLDEPDRDEKKAVGYANIKYLKLVIVSESAPEPTPAKAPEPAAKVAPEPVAAEPEAEGAVKAPVAEAAPKPIQIGVDPSRMPVQISSDRMVYDENGKVVSFVGNVVAEHGELTLWAQKLSAYFSSRSGKKFTVDSVDRIVAEGDVRAKKGKTEGECQKVTYYVDKQLLTMEGDPVLRDGPNSLTGGVINFNVRENRSEVIRDKDKRVRAIFMTPAKIKGQ
ncbi:MAG: LptA/OstA family protein [Pseudodesulfovibrio sp.]